MLRTVEATISPEGVVRLHEQVKVTLPRRALVTIMDETAVDEVTLVSEKALAEDWLQPEEEAAWSSLQSDR